MGRESGIRVATAVNRKIIAAGPTNSGPEKAGVQFPHAPPLNLIRSHWGRMLGFCSDRKLSDYYDYLPVFSGSFQNITTLIKLLTKNFIRVIIRYNLKRSENKWQELKK